MNTDIVIEFKTTAVPKGVDTIIKLGSGFGKYSNLLKVYFDTKYNGAYWNFNRMLRKMFASTTHIVTMEDVIVLCRDFVESVYKVVEANPGEVLSLFYSEYDYHDFNPEQSHWIKTRRVGNQCKVIPVDIISDYLSFCDKYVVDYPNQPPDNPLLAYLEVKGRWGWCAYPSLVDHADSKSVYGSQRRNVAKDFIGEGNSGLDVDWSLGLYNPFVNDYKYRFRCIKEDNYAYDILKGLRSVQKPQEY